MQGRVFGFEMKGYWRDVGTIDAYWQANMDLLIDNPELDLYDPVTAVRTRHANLPPAKIGARARVARSLLNAGDIIHGHVDHSVISPDVYIEEDAVVRNSVLFDGCRVERGAIIERAILDKEVVVGENCIIGAGDDLRPNEDRPDILSSGITIVGKRARLPRGLTIARNCIVAPAVQPDDFDTLTIASGRTILRHRLFGPQGV
jgi:glucose-1-phosphate adenylyltransferase